MTKKTKRIINISIYIALILLAAILVHRYSKPDDTDKEIMLSDSSQSEIEVTITDIAPGGKLSYPIKLQSRESRMLDIIIGFEEGDESGLIPFIDVEVIVKGETVGKGALSEFIEGKQIAFSTKFDKNTPLDVEIVYTMGLDVGDEAQGATADFNIVISSK